MSKRKANEADLDEECQSPMKIANTFSALNLNENFVTFDSLSTQDTDSSGSHIFVRPQQESMLKKETTQGEKTLHKILSQCTTTRPTYALCGYKYKVNNLEGEADIILYDSEYHMMFDFEIKDIEPQNIANNVADGCIQGLRGCCYLQQEWTKRISQKTTDTTDTTPIIGFCIVLPLTEQKDFGPMPAIEKASQEKTTIYKTLEKQWTGLSSLFANYGREIVCFKEDLESPELFILWYHKFRDYWLKNKEVTRANLSENEKNGLKFMDDICKVDIYKVTQQTKKTIAKKWKDASNNTWMIKRVPLTTEQYNLKNNGSKRLVIEGYAGTGKTLCAIDKAKSKATDDAKVVFICHTSNLAKFSRSNCNKQGLVSYFTFHAFLKELCNKKITLDEVSSTVSQLLQSEQIECKYTHFIVDEAQDLDLDNLKLIQKIADQKSDSILWIFRDTLQKYFKPSVDLVVDLSKNSTKFELFKLSYILRHTEKIHKVVVKSFQRTMTGDEEPKFIRTDQEKTDMDVSGLLITNNENYLVQLGTGIRRFLQNANINDCAVLVSYSSNAEVTNTILGIVTKAVHRYLEVNNKLERYTVGDAEKLIRENSRNKTRIYCDTVKRFAGLEATSILLIDLFWQKNQQLEANYLYTGVSRATSYLAVLCLEGTSDALELEDIFRL